METAFQNIFGMFFIMLAAYVLMRKAPFPVEVVNDLVFHFFLPVTVFYSLARLPEIPFAEMATLAAAGFLLTLLACLLARGAASLLGLTGGFRRTFLLGSSYGNHVFLGFPVCYAFLGERGAVLALFFVLGSYVFLYAAGVWIMTGRATARAFFLNPLVVAMGGGTAWAGLGLPLPTLLETPLSLLHAATFPLSMVVVGGGLRFRFFARPDNMLPTFLAAVLKLIAAPALAWAGGLAWGLAPDDLAVCTLQASMPAAVLVTVFSVKYDADPALSNAIVSLTTLASMATIPALFFLLR